MSSIKYRKTDGKSSRVIGAASLLEFVYNVLGITESGILPPPGILNEKLLSGGECNPFGNVDWEPFEIDLDEYEQLCLEIERVAPEDVRSHKGISFVRLRRARELDEIPDSDRWSEAVREKYSDEYVEELMKMNSKEASQHACEKSDENGTSATEEDEPFGIPEADWKRVEAIMYQTARQNLARFAREHQDKVFYAFALDCNSQYADFLLCANTLEGLEGTASFYKEESPDWYGDKPVKEVMDRLRLSVGDWEYLGFNLDYESMDADWEYVSDLMEAFDGLPATDEALDVQTQARESFMECACRALVRLESEGRLGALRATEDFQIRCADHDESEDESKSRLSRIREAYT